MIIHVIDWTLLVLYTLSSASAVYIIAAHMPYFRQRFKSGIVNLFMVAMLFFLSAYTIKMGIAVWIRASEVLGGRTEAVETAQLLCWTIAQVGTTIGLVSLAVLTYTGRFDIWLVLKRTLDKKGE